MEINEPIPSHMQGVTQTSVVVLFTKFHSREKGWEHALTVNAGRQIEAHCFSENESPDKKEMAFMLRKLADQL